MPLHRRPEAHKGARAHTHATKKAASGQADTSKESIPDKKQEIDEEQMQYNEPGNQPKAGPAASRPVNRINEPTGDEPISRNKMTFSVYVERYSSDVRLRTSRFLMNVGPTYARRDVEEGSGGTESKASVQTENGILYKTKRKRSRASHACFKSTDHQGSSTLSIGGNETEL